MRKIKVDSKEHIKQLLYSSYVVGIKDDQFRSFGGFQRWWYDRALDVCHSCGSHWAEDEKEIESCSLKKAAKVLWHYRDSLFLYTKDLSKHEISKIEHCLEDSKL